MFAKSTFMVWQPKTQTQRQTNVLNREPDKRDRYQLFLMQTYLLIYVSIYT